MATKDQQARRQPNARCAACQGKGQVKQVKDGKVREVRCYQCRGTGQGGGYQTK